MTFTEKAMEVSKRYWQGSFEHPFVTGLQDGTLGDSIFRYYLLQDRYYLEHFSKIYQIISDASDDAEVKELASQYGMDEGAVRAAVSVEMLKNDISMKKALALITDSAVEA